MVWLGLIFGFLGLVAVIVGAVLSADSMAFVNSTVTTTGTVVSNAASESCTRDDYGTTCSTIFQPVVEFTAPSGKTIRFTSGVSSTQPRYDAGESVPVRYRPSSPHDARIDGFLDLWFAPTLVGGIGLILLAVGIGILVSHFRGPSKPPTAEVAEVPTWGLRK